MRVLYRDKKCAFAIDWVERIGKRLVLITPNGIPFYTDDYYHENIANGVLTDLVVNGYIIVDKLYMNNGEIV